MVGNQTEPTYLQTLSFVTWEDIVGIGDVDGVPLENLIDPSGNLNWLEPLSENLGELPSLENRGELPSLNWAVELLSLNLGGVPSEYLDGESGCCEGAPQLRTCTSNVRFCRNSLPQFGQDSGLRPCWRSWFTSSNLRKNPAPQSGQLYGLSPPWNLECITRCSSRENDSPHTWNNVIFKYCCL